MKKLFVSFMVLCSVNVIADQDFKDTKCSGPILTLAAISEAKPNGIVETFIKSNLRKQKNSIVFNESLIVKQKGKNKLLISLSKKGKASLLSQIKGKPPGSLSMKGTASCDCFGGSGTNDGCQIRTRGKTMWCESTGDCDCTLETTIKSGIKAINKV